jgi:DNA-directed RNA polymerase subunit M/transcription elongation factor TFIIS
MKTVKIYCQNCNAFLYKYRKDIQGHLVKCYEDMILEDNTNGGMKCPKCGQQFARKRIIHNRRANKIIQGKVYVKG